MNIKAIACAAALSSVVAGGAQASEVLFTVTGSDGFPDITFELPLSPTPDTVYPGNAFQFNSVSAIVGGDPIATQNLAVFNSSLGGGFQFFFPVGDGLGSYEITGDQYYSGTESNPTFLPDVYADQGGYINSEGPTTVTVTITEVPEPATWTLMLAGFGGLGVALRMRRRALTPAA